MPRSSKHKSSKHSSRDYSDSERDSGAKDRKSKDDTSSVKVTKDSSGAEKRRLDSKEVHVHGNGGEYSDEYASSSKRRRESGGGGGGGDRWNGGDEGSKKSSKAIGDSRDSRDLKNSKGEEVKRSSGRHRDSSYSGRKENVEKEKEKDRKVKEGRIEESVDVDQEHRISKQGVENNGMNLITLILSFLVFIFVIIVLAFMYHNLIVLN
jgi:zinc finger CCCH domain-containing protein 13